MDILWEIRNQNPIIKKHFNFFSINMTVEFVLEKCTIVAVKWGKIMNSNEIEIPND